MPDLVTQTSRAYLWKRARLCPVYRRAFVLYVGDGDDRHGLGALPPRVHEIGTLAVGARFDAAYELYAHCAVAREAGLDRQIAARAACRRRRAAGLPLRGRPTKVWRQGCRAAAYLAAAYAVVSMTLDAYDVPAPEVVA